MDNAKTLVPRRTLKPTKKPLRPHIDWDARVDAMFNTSKATPMRQRLARQLGVSPAALVRLRVGWGLTANGSEFSAWPERLANGKYCGVVTRFKNGSKYMLAYSRHGLYYADDWHKGNSPILIPEGGSDTAALLSIGVSAVGRFSATGGGQILAGMLRQHRYRRMLVVGERDYKPDECTQPHCCMKCRPGEFGARRMAAKLSKILGCKVRWCLPPTGDKDIRAWLCRTHGTAGQLFNSLEMVR